MRKDDVKEMFTYACFFATLRLAMGIENTIAKKDINRIAYPAIQFICCLLHFIVYFLGRRFIDKFVAMIVAVYVATHFLVLARVEVMVNQGEDIEEIGKWLRGTITVNTGVTFLLLAPSIDYILFGYAPCVILTTVTCVFRLSLDKKAMITVVVWVFAGIVFWYIFQKRELKRFYEQ